MMTPSSSAPAANHQPDDIRSTWQNFHTAGAGKRHKSVDARYKTHNINHACLPVIDGKTIIRKATGQFIQKTPQPYEDIQAPRPELLQRIPESKSDFGLLIKRRKVCFTC